MPMYPGLAARAWHDPDAFAITRALRSEFDQIRREALAAAGRDFHAESESILRAGDWDVLALYERGWKNEANCLRCPVTARLVEQHAAIKSIAGLAYFSRLSPGAQIAPHRGPTNLRVRCHLALDVPAGDCAIRVAGEQRAWMTGECLVFDDSLEHEAWNLTSRPRLVLVVDLWHPDLSPQEIASLEGLHRFAYAAAQDLVGYWSRNAAARGADVRGYLQADR